MLILVNTLGRVNKQKAVSQIPVALHHLVRVFTQQSEVNALRLTLPPTIQVLALPDTTDGIAQARQMAIDALPKGKVWVIDDLCTFKSRTVTTERIVYKPIDDAAFAVLYEQINTLLDKYIQVGVSPHNGNNRVLADTKTVTRAYSCYGLRTDIMQRAGINFDGMHRDNKDHKYMEDFFITLDSLSKGYPNIVLYNFCFFYAHNTAGGNSTNRTLDGHASSAFELQRRFPLFVKCVHKNGKWGTQMMTNRVDVQVQWRKAFSLGKKRT